MAVLRQITGQNWAVDVGQADNAGSSGTEVASSNSPGRNRQEREEAALREPLVSRAKEVLKASLNAVDDNFGGAGRAERPEEADAPEEA